MSGERKLLVLCALATECAPIARRLGLARAGDLWRGAPRGAAIAAATVGIGPERAQRAGDAVLARERPDFVVIAGVAGALRPELAIAEVLIPAELVSASGAQPLRPSAAASRLADVRPSGALLTVAAVATSAGAKAELYRRHGADAVDMESAAIAALCERRGLPWIAARAISDDAGTDLPAAALALVDAAGRPRLAAAARHILLHPRDLAPLLRLGRDTRAAVAALASAVGAIADAFAAQR